MRVYRASALGGCMKAQVAGHLGYQPMDPPEKMQAVFNMGHVHEVENAAALREQGWTITAQQKELTLPIGDDAAVVGHIDGIIHDEYTKHRVWESKSPGAWRKFHQAVMFDEWDDPLAHRYGWQASIYMHLLDMEMTVTCLDDDGVQMFTIETPPFSMLQITNRVLDMEHTVNSGQLPSLCTSNDYPCPFYYLHEDGEQNEDDPELDSLLGHRAFADRMAKEWKEKRDDYDRQVREYCKGESRKTGLWKVTFYEAAGAGRYDKQKMMEDGVLHQYYTEGRKTGRMKITQREGNDVAE